MNNDFASSGSASDGGMTAKQLYGLLGLAVGIGWIYYNIHTNMKQNKRIAELERLVAADGKSTSLGAAYANFVKQPDSSGVTYGAAPNSIENFDVNEMAAGVRTPNLAIIRKGGQVFIERRV